MSRTSKKDKLFELLQNHASADADAKWSGTLEEYLEMVISKRSLHMSAHKRVLAMIESYGVERDEDGTITSYNFFSDDLFGIDESITQIMEYLRAAASGSEVSRRILLLFGPTSSGKEEA